MFLLGITLILVGYGEADTLCTTVGSTTFKCSDDKECCNGGLECCSPFWSTWRIVVIAGAAVVGVGLIVMLVIVGVYHACFKKNTKSDNKVMPGRLQPEGSSYIEPPPPYEYQNDTPYAHPPQLPPYSTRDKKPSYGDKKQLPQMTEENNEN